MIKVDPSILDIVWFETLRIRALFWNMFLFVVNMNTPPPTRIRNNLFPSGSQISHSLDWFINIIPFKGSFYKGGIYGVSRVSISKSRGTLRCWCLVPHPRKKSKIKCLFKNWSPDPWEPWNTPKTEFPIFFKDLWKIILSMRCPSYPKEFLY